MALTVTELDSTFTSLPKFPVTPRVGSMPYLFQKMYVPELGSYSYYSFVEEGPTNLASDNVPPTIGRGSGMLPLPMSHYLTRQHMYGSVLPEPRIVAGSPQHAMDNVGPLIQGGNVVPQPHFGSDVPQPLFDSFLPGDVPHGFSTVGSVAQGGPSVVMPPTITSYDPLGSVYRPSLSSIIYDVSKAPTAQRLPTFVDNLPPVRKEDPHVCYNVISPTTGKLSVKKILSPPVDLTVKTDELVPHTFYYRGKYTNVANAPPTRYSYYPTSGKEMQEFITRSFLPPKTQELQSFTPEGFGTGALTFPQISDTKPIEA